MIASARRAFIVVVAVVVLALAAGLVVHDSDRTLFGLGAKKTTTPQTLADGSPVPTFVNGSPVPTFRNHTPVPTLPDGTPEPTLADDPRNVEVPKPHTGPTSFVESHEDDPEATWGPVANCPNAEANRPAVLIAQFGHDDGTPLDFNRALEILGQTQVSREQLNRLGAAHFSGFVANPGTVGSLLPGAKRLATAAPAAGEAAVKVEMHCEGHSRSDGSITLVLLEVTDPDDVVYRNGFKDTVDHKFPLRDGKGAALWGVKTDKTHSVRRAIEYMKDRDVLAAYPGLSCPVQNGDPNRPTECGLRVT